MPRAPRPLLTLAALAAAQLATACVSGDSASSLEPGRPLTLTSLEGHTEATVTTDEALTAGLNSLFVRLEPAGESDARVVAAGAFMPAHGHGTEALSIDESDGAYRIDDLNLYMPGRWDITIDLRVSGADDQLEFSVDVK